MNRCDNILDGLRLALVDGSPGAGYSPLYEIASLFLKGKSAALSSCGIRWSTFVAQLEQYASNTYIPVIEFPASDESADIFGETISFVEDLIIRQAGIGKEVAIGLKYMIDECSDNIIEHSRASFGYVSSCVDKDHGFVDICLADKGITVLGSYLINDDKDIASDLEAMQAANRGISTKNRPAAENRGYGLKTTKNMAVSGLGGAFAMISGKTVFVHDQDGRKFFDTSEDMRINGTIVAIRFMLTKDDFSYIDYIE